MKFSSKFEKGSKQILLLNFKVKKFQMCPKISKFSHFTMTWNNPMPVLISTTHRNAQRKRKNRSFEYISSISYIFHLNNLLFNQTNEKKENSR